MISRVTRAPELISCRRSPPHPGRTFERHADREPSVCFVPPRIKRKLLLVHLFAYSSVAYALVRQRRDLSRRSS
jgi:hypothetical protein